MNRRARHRFTLHELLIMAALAALGGVSGSAVSWIGAWLHAVTGLPGNLQFMAGIHVLWLVLAAGLIRKTGAATMTGLLKGAVELLSGNPHGLFVVLMSALAGVVADAVWWVAGRRDRVLTYMLAGGLGAASNLLIFKVIVSLPNHRAVAGALAALALMAFASGAVLGGLLAWSLMNALRRAGVAGTQRRATSRPPAARAWAGAAAALLMVGILVMSMYYSASLRAAKVHGITSEAGGSTSSSRAP